MTKLDDQQKDDEKLRDDFEKMPRQEVEKNTKKAIEERAKQFEEERQDKAKMDGEEKTKEEKFNREELKKENRKEAKNETEENFNCELKQKRKKFYGQLKVNPTAKQKSEVETEEKNIVCTRNKTESQAAEKAITKKNNQELYNLVIKPCIQTDPGSLQRRFKRLLPMIVNFYACNFCKWKFERHTDYVQHMTAQHENFEKNVNDDDATTPGELLNMDSVNVSEKLDGEKKGSFQTLSLGEEKANGETKKIGQKLLSNEIAYDSLIEEQQCLICG